MGYDQDRRLPGGCLCGGPCRPPCPPRPKPPCGCGPVGGYIVEKIVGNQGEKLCFEGRLEISGLPCGLCPPLCLTGVEVWDIRAVCGSCQPGARLQLTVCCFVCDARGCRAQGMAKLEVSSCLSPEGCGGTLRRGAQIAVLSAAFCPPCAFDVCLEICLQTVVSRCELLSGREKSCCSPCPPMPPLYPPPCRPAPKRPCGHFEYFGC